MQIRNEVKVGILATVSLIILFWGYNFLKGRNVFSGEIVVKAIFDSVEGLQIAAPVSVNGFRVGAVIDISLGTKEYAGKVITTLSLENGTAIPDDSTTYALLIQPSLMSGKVVELKYDNHKLGGKLLDGDEVLKGKVAGLMDGIKPVIDPYMQKVDSISQTWAHLASQERGALRETVGDVRAIIGNLKDISDQINNLLLSSSANIAITMSNLKSVTDNLKNNNDQITQMLGNINGITKQVKDGNVDKLLTESRETIETLNKTIGELQNTMKTANETLANVKELTNLSKNEGLVSKLLYDKAFAQELGITIQDVKYLVRDIRLHPERYRTVLSGKKKKYKHTDDKDDPAHKIQ